MGHGNSKQLLEYVQKEKEEEAIQFLDSCYAIDIAYTSNNGDTVLHLACASNMLRLVKKLIENGIDVNVKNNYESTPLHIASRMGHVDIVRALLLESKSKCDVDIPSACGYTAISIACAAGNADIVRLLLEQKAQIQEKTLIVAAMHELHSSSSASSPSSASSSYRSSSLSFPEEIIRMLLSYGANINQTDKHGSTALMYACSRGNEKIVQALINPDPSITSKIDINKQNTYGWSALHFAYAAESDNPIAKRNIIQALIKQGANPELKNNDGEIPSDLDNSKDIYNRSIKRIRLGNDSSHELITQTSVNENNRKDLLQQFETSNDINTASITLSHDWRTKQKITRDNEEKKTPNKSIYKPLDKNITTTTITTTAITTADLNHNDKTLAKQSRKRKVSEMN